MLCVKAISVHAILENHDLKDEVPAAVLNSHANKTEQWAHFLLAYFHSFEPFVGHNQKALPFPGKSKRKRSDSWP
jgi:hypothetical protein